LSYFVFLVVFSSFCDPFLQIYSRVLSHFFAHAMYLFGKNSLMTVCFLLGLWLKLNLQKPTQVFWLFKFLPFFALFLFWHFCRLYAIISHKKMSFKENER